MHFHTSRTLTKIQLVAISFTGVNLNKNGKKANLDRTRGFSIYFTDTASCIRFGQYVQGKKTCGKPYWTRPFNLIALTAVHWSVLIQSFFFIGRHSFDAIGSRRMGGGTVRLTQKDKIGSLFSFYSLFCSGHSYLNFPSFTFVFLFIYFFGVSDKKLSFTPTT